MIENISLIATVLILTFTMPNVFAVSSVEHDAQIHSPYLQIAEGVLSANVLCTDDRQLMLKYSNSLPTCVFHDSVSKLKERGWGWDLQSWRYPYHDKVLEKHYFTNNDAQTFTVNSMDVFTLINNGVIYDIKNNDASNSLKINITSHDYGYLIIDIPQGLVSYDDGKSPFANFLIIMDGIEVYSKELIPHLLKIDFPPNAKQIEIIGTFMN